MSLRFLKTKFIISRSTIRFFYFILVLIFPFLQFCDSKIELSIPKKNPCNFNRS
ncbi:hypothetical protein LEP1GSC172_0284 [Leptospira noguchii]|uniref:Uncharacterized protein n=1 Tax=Leptospira noguchii TaxID=28182 RepID=M6V6A8_9LEPT|nr:hypothetical protein LEP1GSC172_0284 [Leptospira noguchii]